MNVPNNAVHAPLHALDSETQTHGCRHTAPNFCGKNSIQGVCAFVRKDNICLSPPWTWKKQFQKLFFQKFRKRKQNAENDLALAIVLLLRAPPLYRPPNAPRFDSAPVQMLSITGARQATMTELCCG